MDILTFVGSIPVGKIPAALKAYQFGAKKSAKKGPTKKALTKKIPLKGKGKK